MKIIGFIPARGGSKGIPRKNIKPLNGLPLICHSIRAALSSHLDAVVISTDDAEIMAIASQYVNAHFASMAEKVTYHHRPESLAGDESTIFQAVEHYFLASQCARDDVVMILQPTSPLRMSNHIDDVIAMLQVEQETSIVSVCVPMQHPNEMLTLVDGKLNSIIPCNQDQQRQSYLTCYYINGAIYAISFGRLMATKKFMDETSRIYLMNTVTSLDIDEQEVFDLVDSYAMSR